MTDHQQPLTETQALAWLQGRPDGTIATTVSDLARTWGWNRSTTSRRVKVWVASGQIVRAPGPDGRSVFTARTPDVPPACDAAAVPVSPSAKSLVIPAVSWPVQSAAQGEHSVAGTVQHFGSPIGGTSHACRRRRGSCGARGGGGLVRNPDQCLVWRHAGPHPRGQHTTFRPERLG
jgi:hypothetical protein